VPGIPEAMRAHSLNMTGKAMLSRAASGIRGDSLIINLPGSPKAAREILDYILLAVAHGLDMLLGTATD
jgi:molybdopterin biosynthesis enzyme MoaB